MSKIQQLREYLLAAPLGLKGDKLITMMDDGKALSFNDGDNSSFRLEFNAHVIATDATARPATLILFILKWLQIHEAGLKPDAVSFEIDILDTSAADIAITFPLTEDYAVSDVEGGTQVELIPDPDFDLDSLTGFGEDFPSGIGGAS